MAGSESENRLGVVNDISMIMAIHLPAKMGKWDRWRPNADIFDDLRLKWNLQGIGGYNLSGSCARKTSSFRRCKLFCKTDMWWTRFLQNGDAIASLPHETLVAMRTSAASQLLDMHEQESVLQSKITDVSFEICATLSTENQSTLMKGFADISVDEHRFRQLKATYNALLYEAEICEQEIRAQETMQSQMNMGDKNIDLPPQVRILCAKLAEVAISTEDRRVRDDCLLGLDVMTGSMKFIPVMIKQNKTFFQRRSADLRSELDGLIRKTARTVKKLHDLGVSLEDTTQRVGLKPMLPKMKQQLKQELEQMGDQRGRLLSAKTEVETLMAERDELQNECSMLSAAVLSRHADVGPAPEEVKEIVDLRQRKEALKVEDHELVQKGHVIESEMKDVRETMTETRRETKELSEQRKLLKSAMDEQKWKFELLKSAAVSSDDVEVVFNASQNVSLEALKRVIAQKKGQIKLLQRRHESTDEKLKKLVAQEERIDEQRRNLDELIDTAEMGE